MQHTKILLAATLGLCFNTISAQAATYNIIGLGTLGGSSSSASGINDSGQVVGSSYVAGNVGLHPFLYSNGVMTDIGTSGGAALGINNNGQVVGYSNTVAGFEHAFLYSNGAMTDLNTLDSLTSIAYGINNSGQVVGK